MFPVKIKSCYVCLFMFMTISLASGAERKITSKLNPGCDSCPPHVTLLYVRAEGASDTIHQIWDFTRGIPTIIFSVAGVNSTLNISWDGRIPKEFQFSEKLSYSFAFVLDKIVEYDDIEDQGAISALSPQRAYPLHKTSWTLTRNVTTGDEALLQVEGRRFKSLKGVIVVKLDLLPYKDYAQDLPHLIHTSNSTLVDLSIVNLTTTKEYNASRYAWHATLVSTDPAVDTMHCIMRKSLDDEHTPGVFEMIELKTPASFTSGAGGFAQFRPVAYTEPARAVTTSTLAHVSNLNRTTLPSDSTVEEFYKDFDKENLLIQDIFISFGEPGDGYYAHHNYTAWSFTVGYGAPPVEGFSLFVILVISIGLGVPVLLALSGITYVITRRVRQRNAHRRFVDQ